MPLSANYLVEAFSMPTVKTGNGSARPQVISLTLKTLEINSQSKMTWIVFILQCLLIAWFL